MPLACPVDTYIPCWEQVLAADRSSKLTIDRATGGIRERC